MTIEELRQARDDATAENRRAFISWRHARDAYDRAVNDAGLEECFNCTEPTLYADINSDGMCPRCASREPIVEEDPND